MIIVATFTGQDGSLGYRTGRVYKLKVEANNIRRLDDTGWCPYKSLTGFLKNWTNVRQGE